MSYVSIFIIFGRNFEVLKGEKLFHFLHLLIPKIFQVLNALQKEKKQLLKKVNVDLKLRTNHCLMK